MRSSKNKLSEYVSWGAMKQRCYNKASKSYKYYGQRGIVVCDEWIKSFDTFYLQMGPKPSPKHSLDRIDVNGNYTKENCRWATSKEQANNKTIYGSNSEEMRERVKKREKWEELKEYLDCLAIEDPFFSQLYEETLLSL